jgi:hypothetical protein
VVVDNIGLTHSIVLVNVAAIVNGAWFTFENVGLKILQFCEIEVERSGFAWGGRNDIGAVAWGRGGSLVVWISNDYSWVVTLSNC